MEDTRKTQPSIEIFNISILRNSIRSKTLLKLLSGFNSKKRKRKNTFPIKVGRKDVYREKGLNILTQYLYIWFLSVN